MRLHHIMIIIMMMAIVLLWGTSHVYAEQINLPSIQIGIDGERSEPTKISTALLLVIVLTILSLAPAILILLTSFTRIVVVLSFLRQAIGTPQMPPNQVIIGLSLFLTIFVMSPVWFQINNMALQPFLSGEIDRNVAYENSIEPIRHFMFRQTRKKDLDLFAHIAKLSRPENKDDIPTHVLVPAFVVSELKTAFEMGFFLFVPFLIIDLVVSSVLLSMGMMMLPPVMVSLPFKLLLFVLVDGWYLVISSVTQSFF